MISAAGLFERLQERIPPALLNDWLTYDEMPWASPLAVQTQIKRTDVILALFLPLVTAPILLLSMFVIRLMIRSFSLPSATDRLDGLNIYGF